MKLLALAAGVVLAIAGTVSPVDAAPDASSQLKSGSNAGAITFVRDGAVVRVVDRATLISCSVERIEIDDPYYAQVKSFWACPLHEVLTLGFGSAPLPGADANFFLRALDGFTKPASGAKLAEEGGYLALSDASLGTPAAPGWEPIDRRQVDPGPFYLVWNQPHQRDIHHYPWPYQLATIEIAAFETEYPHTLPGSAAITSPAGAGFRIFRSECIACHAINGEGGMIGPDLNVPRSIVEYRPTEQIKAFIRDPQSFRYTTMPAHPHLGDDQLDALVAYFTAMKDLKYDPRAR
jgi:mono/diheme cytochrome c family protein